MARKPKKKHEELDLTEDLVNEVEAGPNMGPSEEAEFLQYVRECVAEGWAFWQDIFDAADDDVKFRTGGAYQWPEYAQRDRQASGRPMLTFNDLPQFLAQVIGDQRQNPTAIHVAPGDDLGAGGEIQDVKGRKFTLAEAREAMIRNIEHQSSAEQHYETAHEHALEGGFGWLRVITSYANPTSFDLDIRIKSLKNRWSAMIDPSFEEPDASDTKWGIIADWMPAAQFRRLYPDKAEGQLLTDPQEWWGTKERMAVCEWMERYAAERELLLLQSGEVVWRDEHDDADLREIGVQRSRKVDTWKVRWWKLTGNAVLRGPVDIPCSSIPLVPVFGREVRGRDFAVYEGLIRHAKDPKRADNFWMTAATERVALSPNAPWIGTAKMFEGHETAWSNANRGNPAYLTYNWDDDVPGAKPERQQPATMPVAELQMAASMTEKVKSAIGMYDAGLGARSNETSGRAITARQRESDVGTFVFPDNLSRAIRRVGIIINDMIPRVYDGQRTVRMRFPDGKGAFFEANKTVTGPDGKPIVINDLGVGAFETTVKSGPSYTTQREEAATALMEFVRVVPDVGAIVVDKIAQAMDWPGADEIAKRAKHLVPRHMLSDEEREELGKGPKPEPTPEQQAEMARAQADMAKADADKEKAKADIAKAEADIAQARAQMAEIEAGAIDNEHMARIKDLIEETISELMIRQEQPAREGEQA